MIGYQVDFPSEALKAMAYAHTGHIILACDSNRRQGLHQMLESGKYAGQIAKGRFSAICSFNKKVYVTETKKKKVLIFTHKRISWIQIGGKNIF